LSRGIVKFLARETLHDDERSDILCQGGWHRCLELVNDGPGAGTPDRFAPIPGQYALHLQFDVFPFDTCKKAGMLQQYFDLRPPNLGKGKDGKPCDKFNGNG
jgi:hypothetical protein